MQWMKEVEQIRLNKNNMLKYAHVSLHFLALASFCMSSVAQCFPVQSSGSLGAHVLSPHTPWARSYSIPDHLVEVGQNQNGPSDLLWVATDFRNTALYGAAFSHRPNTDELMSWWNTVDSGFHSTLHCFHRRPIKRQADRQTDGQNENVTNSCCSFHTSIFSLLTNTHTMNWWLTMRQTESRQKAIVRCLSVF